MIPGLILIPGTGQPCATEPNLVSDVFLRCWQFSDERALWGRKAQHPRVFPLPGARIRVSSRDSLKPELDWGMFAEKRGVNKPHPQEPQDLGLLLG